MEIASDRWPCRSVCYFTNLHRLSLMGTFRVDRIELALEIRNDYLTNCCLHNNALPICNGGAVADLNLGSKQTSRTTKGRLQGETRYGRR